MAGEDDVENVHDRFLFFGTAVAQRDMAERQFRKLSPGDMALFPPATALFDKMNKKRMYITADHGEPGFNAQGFPCIKKHPVKIGEFLFDYRNPKTGNYDICGMLYGNKAGRAMSKSILNGNHDSLSLSHETYIYKDPTTGQDCIAFSGNHVAILNSSETAPGRKKCIIHHIVSLSGKNSLMNEMKDLNTRRENRRLTTKIAELTRNLNEYLAKNPPFADTQGSVESQKRSADERSMSDQTQQTTSPPEQKDAPEQQQQEAPQGPSIEELEQNYLKLAEDIDTVKKDPTQWFASAQDLDTAMNSEDTVIREKAREALANMTLREKELVDLKVAITEAKYDMMKKTLIKQEEAMKKREEALRAQNGNSLKGNYMNLAQTCGAEAGFTETNNNIVNRAIDAATKLGGPIGQEILSGYQVMSTQCSNLGRKASEAAASRFGQSSIGMSSRVGSLFQSSGGSLPFSQTHVRDAAAPPPNKRKRLASEALREPSTSTKEEDTPVYHSFVMNSTSSTSPVYTTPPASGQDWKARYSAAMSK